MMLYNVQLLKKEEYLNKFGLPVDFKADSAYTEFNWRNTIMRGVSKKVHHYEDA
jgi:hypothetical protein